MKLLKCDICESTFKPENNTTLDISTVETTITYEDVCPRCEKKIKQAINELVDMSRCKAVCKECGHAS